MAMEHPPAGHQCRSGPGPLGSDAGGSETTSTTEKCSEFLLPPIFVWNHPIAKGWFRIYIYIYIDRMTDDK